MSAEHLNYLSEEFAKIDDTTQLTAVAVGAATACWEKVEDAGEFDSDRATDVMAAYIARMTSLVRERLVASYSLVIEPESLMEFELFEVKE